MNVKTRSADRKTARWKMAAAGLLILLAALLTLVPFNCNVEKEAPEPFRPEYTRTLVIGLIPEVNIFSQVERYKPLGAYLSEKTGVGIEFKILSRYGNVVRNFKMMGLDGAFFGSFTYVLAHEKIAVEVLARPESSEGVSTYHGMIFVRKDSKITSAALMKGKRFAFVDKATTAGYLLPLKYFRENGIEDYREYFSETYFTGTHEDAVLDVLNGKADIGAAKNTVFYRLAADDKRILDELEVLDRSPEVPENALALRSDLDESVRSEIRDALLGMDKDPKGREVLAGFGQSRFMVTTNGDYEPVYKYAEAAGLDLANYDWMND